jgi:hypothetical protein
VPHKPNRYWTAYRESALKGREARRDAPLNKADALAEIERALCNAFPAVSEVTARTDVSELLVKFVTGEKPVAVRVREESLMAYATCTDTIRRQALETLRLVCSFAFVTEYTPSDDPVNPFVIDAEMALSARSGHPVS